jgi:hypothetical protein
VLYTPKINNLNIFMPLRLFQIDIVNHQFSTIRRHMKLCAINLV